MRRIRFYLIRKSALLMTSLVIRLLNLEGVLEGLATVTLLQGKPDSGDRLLIPIPVQEEEDHLFPVLVWAGAE